MLVKIFPYLCADDQKRTNQEMTEPQYLLVIKIRAMMIVLQDEMDVLAKQSPLWKTNLKNTGNVFRKNLEREMESLYKHLPEDVVMEYNKLSNAIQEGVQEIIKVSIID